MVLRMIGGGLIVGQGAVLDVLMDAPVLVLEAIIDLGTARMLLLPGRLTGAIRRQRRARIAGQVPIPRSQMQPRGQELSVFNVHSGTWCMVSPEQLALLGP